MPKINWAFVPLLIFIFARSVLTGEWLYGVLVIAAGLVLGLFLRHRQQRRAK